MKLQSWLLVLFLLPLLTACIREKHRESQLTMDSKQEIRSLTSIEFQKTTHDFGQINASREELKCTFPFTNTGESPLVISHVETSCGCVKAGWPKAPIAPGEKGKIVVTFNVKGRKYGQIKALTVYSNTEKGEAVLKVIGEIN